MRPPVVAGVGPLSALYRSLPRRHSRAIAFRRRCSGSGVHLGEAPPARKSARPLGKDYFIHKDLGSQHTITSGDHSSKQACAEQITHMRAGLSAGTVGSRPSTRSSIVRVSPSPPPARLTQMRSKFLSLI